MKKWLPTLEKKLEAYSEGSHENYRVYISAEPAGTPESHIIPQGILESSIKITNEPPTGMMANLHQALDNFNQVSRRVFSDFLRSRSNTRCDVVCGIGLPKYCVLMISPYVANAATSNQTVTSSSTIKALNLS